MTTDHKLARLLRRLRSKVDVSLRDMAARAGVSVSYLHRVEAADQAPSPKVLDAYATHCDTDRDALYQAAGRVPPDVELALAQPGAFDRLRGTSDTTSSDTEDDQALLHEVVEHDDTKVEEREAFVDMLDTLTSGRVTALSPAQRAWAKRVALRIGTRAEDAANLFSSLPPDEQRRQREAASKVKLPWER